MLMFVLFWVVLMLIILVQNKETTSETRSFPYSEDGTVLNLKRSFYLLRTISVCKTIFWGLPWVLGKRKARTRR